MIEARLLKNLCCPESYQTLTAASDSVIQRLNQQIEAGQLKNRAGQLVKEKIDGGLIREDHRYLYPIRQVPIMLMDEAIPLPPGPP